MRLGRRVSSFSLLRPAGEFPRGFAHLLPCGLGAALCCPDVRVAFTLLAPSVHSKSGVSRQLALSFLI